MTLVAACGVFGGAVSAAALDGKDLSDLYFSALANLEYKLEPAEGDEDAPRPLCLLLPGGTGDERAAQGTLLALGPALVKRGWAVVVPIAPDGKSFFGRNAKLVPRMIEDLKTREDITDDRVVVVGVSNGGIAALEIAAEEPKLFSAVVVVPGVISRDTRVQRLKGMPIYLRIGENDNLKWGLAFPQIEKQLREAGARLDAKLLAGVGHGVPINWNELDAWLERELGKDLPVPRLTAPLTSIPSSANRAARTWTSLSGSTVMAVLVRVEADTVVLRQKSGSMARIRVSQLSAADQQYLRELTQGGAAE